jgi:hypothetical protein
MFQSVNRSPLSAKAAAKGGNQSGFSWMIKISAVIALVLHLPTVAGSLPIEVGIVTAKAKYFLKIQ